MAHGLFLALSISALISSLVLLALATIDLALPKFKFWPPPEGQPWKKSLFMTLFRVLVYGLTAASVLHLWQSGFPTSKPVNLLAASFLVGGFAVALSATGVLGWRNAFGANEGLRTDGIFAYSRNPIYIATWLGLAGWALLVPAPIIAATLTCWGLLYLVAVFLEERWLLQEYGAAFQEFRDKVPRFL